MSKHTPGPWSIDGDILLTHADPFEATPFGRVNINHAFTEDEREANRVLIIAAPDLLEALNKYEQAFDALFAQCCSNGMKDAWGKPVDCTLINEAHFISGKAIARAKGESS